MCLTPACLAAVRAGVLDLSRCLLCGFSFLRAHGAETVSVASLDYVLDRDNPLFAKLEAFLRR